MDFFSGFGLSLSNEGTPDSTLELVRQADSLGFTEVSIPESRTFRSVISMTAAALTTTNDVSVRVGIVNPLTRHPLTLAMEAATLSELGPGRLRFGLGAAEWTMRALGLIPPGWRPYTATVEAVRAVKRLTGGMELGFEPETFILPADTRLEFAPQTKVPVDVGAVNARMLKAAGEHADGVQLGAITSPGYTRWARTQIESGLASAGRSADDFLLSANILTSVASDRNQARQAVREVLAYYLARVEGVVVSESGADPELVARLRQVVEDDGLAAGADVVTDDLIDTFAVAGDVDDVVGGMRRFLDEGLDVPLAWYTFGPDQRSAIETLASEVMPVVTAR